VSPNLTTLHWSKIKSGSGLRSRPPADAVPVVFNDLARQGKRQKVLSGLEVPLAEKGVTLKKQLDADLLSHEEIDRLLRACSKRAPTGRRNRALIATLWRCGLRIGEALALTPKDVDLQEFVIRIQEGKSGKRVVGLDLSTALLTEQWLASRKKLHIPAQGPLFCTLSGGPLDQSYVRHLLPRLAKKAGIERRVHAHGLRHRYASDLIREGADLITVRDLLGHASAATTQVYLSRIGASGAVEFARQREWSAP
jgi:site-specific recombinase XerD